MNMKTATIINGTYVPFIDLKNDVMNYVAMGVDNCISDGGNIYDMQYYVSEALSSYFKKYDARVGGKR